MSAEVMAAAVREMLAQAQRLGLTWVLRPGAVQSITAPYDAWRAAVLLDGDSDPVQQPVTSLAGPLAPGMRVMVCGVPPSGWYALGVISTADVTARVVALPTASPAATGEQVSLTLPAVRLRPGAAYRVRVGSLLLSGANAYYQLRVGSRSGPVVGMGPWITGFGLAPSNGQWLTYIANQSGADIVRDLVLTVVSASGQAIHLGSTAAPRYLEVEYAGPAVSYPQAVAVT